MQEIKDTVKRSIESLNDARYEIEKLSESVVTELEYKKLDAQISDMIVTLNEVSKRIN